MLSKLAKVIKNAFRVLGEKGYTLIEMAAVVAITATLAAVVVPVAMDKVEAAKLAKAQQDVSSISAAITSFIANTGQYPFFVSASGSMKVTPTNTYQVLTSSGGEPAVADASYWVVNPGVGAGDTIENQLVANVPHYAPGGDAAWLGPYIDATKMATGDPWGQSYYVNIGAAHAATITALAAAGGNAVFVLSAGPNKEIETLFLQGPGQPDKTVVVGGDDIVARVK